MYCTVASLYKRKSETRRNTHIMIIPHTCELWPHSWISRSRVAVNISLDLTGFQWVIEAKLPHYSTYISFSNVCIVKKKLTIKNLSDETDSVQLSCNNTKLIYSLVLLLSILKSKRKRNRGDVTLSRYVSQETRNW